MCLLGFLYKENPKYPFVFVSNRDELYTRETSAAHFWEELPHLLAGKDLEKGGSWLGISDTGDFAALTNVRDTAGNNSSKSRGDLIKSFFKERKKFQQNLVNSNDYDGFNLIYGNMNNLFYHSNRSETRKKITKGVHVLSNAALNTQWPKVVHLKEGLEKLLVTEDAEELVRKLFKISEADSHFSDEMLPDTGVGIELERILSPLFIKSEKYGTRSSTVILLDNENNCTFIERTYVPERMERRFQFKITNKK